MDENEELWRKMHMIQIKKEDLDHPKKILEIIRRLLDQKLAYGFCVLWSEDLSAERLDFLFGGLYENSRKFTMKEGVIKYE